MLFFMGLVSLASAETVIQLNFPPDGPVQASSFVSNQRFYLGDGFAGDTIYESAFNATGTLSTMVTTWRFINFGGFNAGTPYQLQLFRGVTPATGTVLDCQSEGGKTAGDYGTVGVYATTTFNFTGTQCQLVPLTDYGFIIAGGSDSGASSYGTYATSTSNNPSINLPSILIFDETGPTNPDLLNFDTPFSNPIDFETRFTNGVASGASTSVVFDIDYILNTAEYTANTRPDYIRATVIADGFLNDQQVADGTRLILPLADGLQSATVPVSAEYSLVDGDYYAYINFFNINTGSITFSRTSLIISFEVSGGVVISSTVVEIADGLEVSTEIEYQECGLTNIYGCIVNATIFVFVPTDGSLNRFATLYERIENKPPFGYVTSVSQALTGINANTTPAFDFGTIPFINTIFDPLKALFTIGLWVIYALFFMGRLDKLDI